MIPRDSHAEIAAARRWAEQRRRAGRCPLAADRARAARRAHLRDEAVAGLLSFAIVAGVALAIGFHL